MKNANLFNEDFQGRISSKELKYNHALYSENQGNKKPKDKEKKKDYAEERKRKRGE